jgi:WD40 repeat protein
VATEKNLARLQRDGQWITALAFSPDGSVLASAEQNHMIHLWDPATGSEVAQLNGEANSPASRLLFSPDNRLLAAITHNQEESKMVIWELASLSVRRELTG